MGVTVEVGYGLTSDGSLSRPADVLVARWERGLPAALDITVTSPLTPDILDESCSTAGIAAVAAESCRHVANDVKCADLGWTCVLLAVETYGNWCSEAQETFLSSCCKPQCDKIKGSSRHLWPSKTHLSKICGQGYPA
eukprot:Em0001g2951a